MAAVGRGRRRASPRAVLLTGIAGVLAGVLVFLGITALIGSGDGESNLGDDVFAVGRADRLAPEIQRRGPLLFQALVGERDVYVQYLGDERWTAFEAVPPGSPRRCQLRWRPRTRDFHDPCSRRTYPHDGAGLTRYPASVDDDGTVVVDLRRPQAATSTVAPTTTTTTPR